MTEDIIKKLQCEIERASDHGKFNSLHEAFGVLQEEVDEFWDEVKQRAENRDHEGICDELIQIAVVAMKATRLVTPDSASLATRLAIRLREYEKLKEHQS